MWVARDEDKSLHLFDGKIIRITDKCPLGYWQIPNGYFNSSMQLDEKLFPDLKWEDEPIEVHLNTGYDMADQINHVWAMLKCTQDELDKAHQTIMYYRTKFEAIDKIINDKY